MSAAIVVLLLVGFSLCVVVGLLTVLQNLAAGDGTEDSGGGSMLQDRSTE
jgi:hypothetical protein